MNRPTVGSLFTGIGGLDLGLEWAGFTTAWQCERDEWCRGILGRHWPGIGRYSDVHDVNESAEWVDVIAGGFPCQPVSVAGKRLAQADERWLWPEFARIIGVLRPRIALMENVAGLLARGFGDVLGDLAALGYDAEWHCIRAADVGAPHKRERIFIVAHTDSPGLQGHRGEHGLHAPVQKVQTDGRRSEPSPNDARRGRGHWSVEPGVGRMADGVPNRVDRIRALGNAVVPQVAEQVGRLIMQAHFASENRHGYGHE
jgi:DNA (cytosine-5)-methyltransferase 1